MTIRKTRNLKPPKHAKTGDSWRVRVVKKYRQLPEAKKYKHHKIRVEKGSLLPLPKRKGVYKSDGKKWKRVSKL